jgi:hypothetical protein
MKHKWQAAFKCRSQDEGFTLFMALGMGLLMLTIATTLIFRASRHEAIASTRTHTGDSLAVAEAGVARTLAQMTKPENAVLLNRNYDPLNPKTSKNYLGADGIPNTTDQTTTGVDEWTTYSPTSVSCSTTTTNPSISYSGTVGTDGQYALLAYRYNSTDRTGTFLVEGRRENSISHIAVTVSIDSNPAPFPGVLAKNSIKFDNRQVLGTNGNVYYDSASSPTPGLTNVAGKIINCQLNPTLSNTFSTGIPGATYEGGSGVTINSTTTISGHLGGITYYELDKLDLDSEILTVDTKDGPVYLYANEIKFNNTAQIVHVNSGGGSPKLGDLRIIIKTNKMLDIHQESCIDGAFIYAPDSELKLRGTNSACSGFKIRGVVWAESIANDNNNNYGISVPDTIDNLTDINTSVNLSNSYRLGATKNWRQYQL